MIAANDLKMNKDISSHKLAHLRDLTERIYTALTGDLSK